MTIKTNSKDSSDIISVVSSENEDMNIAIAKAQGSFPDFLKALKNGCDKCDKFLAKIRLSYGDQNGEHVWMDNLHFDNSRLYGRLANVPEDVTRVSFGDTLEIKADSLSDWAYIQNEELKGGYTLKVIFKNLDIEGRKQMERDLGAKINLN